MKRTKLIVNGRNRRGMYVGYTWKQILAWRIRQGMRLALIALILWGGAEAYRFANPKIVTAEIKTEVAVDPAYPVLERIAEAESYSSHFCTEKLVKLKACKKSELGQVLMKPNTNGSVDVGKYAINNTAWGYEAYKLGLDITDEKDNYEMALWIYKNKGTDPWYSSAHKW